MDTDERRYLKGKGVLYWKVSPSGKQSEIGNAFSRFKVPQQPFMAFRDDTHHHYAIIDFQTSDAKNTGQMVVTVYGIPVNEGQEKVIDRFAILQSIKE